MLCRAVLSAVAITCTFCREIIAQPNPLDDQRIVQIKDLICVLWLSGLQKEDLDLNMLRKLERHKLNIDDMNNETLRQECITPNISKATNLTQNENEETTISSPNLNDRHDMKNFHTSNNFLKMAQYFINMDKLENRFKIENEEKEIDNKTKSKVDNQNILEARNRKEDNNNIPNLVTESTVDKIVLDNNPNIESIMTFWNTIANKNMRNKSQTVKESSEYTTEVVDFPKTQKIIPHSTQPKEIDLMSKLIAEYISKTRVTVQTTTDAASINFNKISVQIQNIMENAKNNQLPVFKDKFKYEMSENFGNKQNKYVTNNETISKDDSLMNPRRTLNLKEIEQFNNRPHTENEKKNERNGGPVVVIDDILKLKKQFKLFASITSIQNIFTENANFKSKRKQKFETQIQKQLEDANPTQNPQTIFDPRYNLNTPPIGLLPKGLIQEIAEKVKAIVLNDLIKYTTTIAASTLTTSKVVTTENPPLTVSLVQNKTHETNQVIKKLMELFQQYKTIKDGNILTADTKYAMTKKKEVEHEFIPAPGIKKKLSLEPTEVIKSNTNFSLNKWNPKIFPPKFASLMPLEQNYINIPIMRNTPKHRSNLTPVMIQTNSNEIPPLVLPMSKHLKLINQNIIVTTKVPYELIKNNSSHWSSRLKNQGNVYSNSNFKYNKEKSQYISANNRDRTIPYQRLKASYKDNPMHDHQGYEYSNFNNNHGEYAYNRDDVINSNVDHNGMHNRVSVNYRTGHEINDNSHTRLNYGERFHERLERGDDWLPNYNDNKYKVENREGCCKMKVASRQQLPLNSVKKQTKYDDTHFKNFLKTQQKVNDMLERILATKTKSDGPRSVETP